jgi:sugar lactone lactonase YvrE
MSIWRHGNATSSRCVHCDDATRDCDRAGAGTQHSSRTLRPQERVVASGAKVEKLVGGFEFTEGPTCDAQGNLFFTDQPNDRIMKWSVDGSDGMTLDNEGNVYLMGKGVLVFDRTGRQIEAIAIPEEEWTANVSFCGQDRRTLFITASKGLYRIRTRVRGANAAK